MYKPLVGVETYFVVPTLVLAVLVVICSVSKRTAVRWRIACRVHTEEWHYHVD